MFAVNETVTEPPGVTSSFTFSGNTGVSEFSILSVQDGRKAAAAAIANAVILLKIFFMTCL